MSLTYKGTGARINFTAGADYSSGDVLVVKSGLYGLIGIVIANVANGSTGVAELEGVHEKACVSTDTASIGTAAYWDDSAKNFTTTSTNNTLAGIFETAKTNGQTTARIKINGCPVTLTGAATLTGTETLTNKTLTTPTINAAVFTGTSRSSNTTTAVAAAGSTVADAGALPDTTVSHITCDSAAKGVKLPAVAAGGIMRWVINDSATAAKLYAESTGTVNGLSADAAVVIPASKGTLCVSTAAKTWITFDLTAKSTTA